MNTPEYLTAEPIETRVGYLVKRTQQALRSEMDRALRRIKLTTPQYAALVMLRQHEGLSNAGLAEKCFVTPQTMHQIVVRLEQLGLVLRYAHPDHGKIQQTRLTARGRETLVSADELVVRLEQRMTRNLSQTEQEGVVAALEKCVAALQTPQ